MPARPPACGDRRLGTFKASPWQHCVRDPSLLERLLASRVPSGRCNRAQLRGSSAVIEAVFVHRDGIDPSSFEMTPFLVSRRLSKSGPSVDPVHRPVTLGGEGSPRERDIATVSPHRQRVRPQVGPAGAPICVLGMRGRPRPIAGVRIDLLPAGQKSSRSTAHERDPDPIRTGHWPINGSPRPDQREPKE